MSTPPQTVLFELAILRLLKSQNFHRTAAGSAERLQGGKVVYLAPLKTLCQEKLMSWGDRFGRVGVKVMELSGDVRLQRLTAQPARPVHSTVQLHSFSDMHVQLYSHRPIIAQSLHRTNRARPQTRFAQLLPLSLTPNSPLNSFIGRRSSSLAPPHSLPILSAPLRSPPLPPAPLRS